MADLATTSRPRRMAWPTAVVAGLGAATLAVHLRDPHVSGSWGLCPSARLGLWCPGCGGLRAVHDLTHLDVGAALSSNLLVVLALPLVAVLLGRWATESWTGEVRPAWRRADLMVAAGLVAMLVFTVLRNLAIGSWLAP